MDLFVYGTLRHPAVRSAVLGQDKPAKAIQPARLAGFAVCRVAGASYPMIVPSKTEWTDGLLLAGLSPDEVERLDRFETDDYKRQACMVQLADAQRDAHAEVYMPAARLVADGPWLYDQWVQHGMGQFWDEDFNREGVRLPE